MGLVRKLNFPTAFSITTLILSLASSSNVYVPFRLSFWAATGVLEPRKMVLHRTTRQSVDSKLFIAIFLSSVRSNVDNAGHACSCVAGSSSQFRHLRRRQSLRPSFHRSARLQPNLPDLR